MNEVFDAAGRADEDVAAGAKRVEDFAHRRAAVNDRGGDAGAIAELRVSEARKAYALRFLVDLQSQLARGGEDQAGREVVVAVVVGERRGAGPVSKHGDDDGEEEARRFAGTCDD